MGIRKTLLAAVAVGVMVATMQAGTVFAQNTGVGGDGYTRLLWRGTDYSISLWKLDPSLNAVTSHTYGPYPGWTPVALTTGTSSYSYILWRYTDGSIGLWLVDPNLNFVSGQNYGPYKGWTAKGLSVSTSSNNDHFRVVWRYTDGSVSIWDVDSALNFGTAMNFGPYFGYDPGYTAE